VSDEPLRVDREGAVLRLTLDRPEAANTVDLALARRLRDEVRRAAADPGLRVVVVAGADGAFCAGGDIGAMVEAADPAAFLAELATTFHEALTGLLALDAVVVAAVDGAVAGGGLGLALHADLILATERSRFLTAYEQVGLTPDSGVSDLLPRAIGTQRALELTMTGRRLDARTAMAWGLVAEVAADAEELDAVLAAHVGRWSAAPTAHLAATRRAYRARDEHTAHLAAEARGIAAAARAPHAQERLRGFARRAEQTGGR
jgi:2-(1,2-epoxy-1,2-dihydrophenyl)acetyl-CoA isomerase